MYVNARVSVRPGGMPVPKSDNQSIRPIVLVSERILQRFPALLGQLTLGLAEKSIPTTVVCAPGIELVSLLRGAVEVIRYPSCDLPLAERMGQRGLLEQLAHVNPTVLHCLCETKAPQARKWARSLDIPYVLNVNTLQDHADTICLSATRCVCLICPTRTIAKNLGLTLPRLVDRIVQIEPGVFVEDQCCCFRDPQRQASLVMAHPFERAEAFAPVFKALRGLLCLGYEFNAVLMGHGPAERSIRGMLMEMDLMQVVTIVPELDPWRPVLAAGDIFIQPQTLRELNFFLLEAMSVGAAVAACQGGVDDGDVVWDAHGGVEAAPVHGHGEGCPGLRVPELWTILVPEDGPEASWKVGPDDELGIGGDLEGLGDGGFHHVH